MTRETETMKTHARTLLGMMPEVMLGIALLCTVGCEREERRLREIPPYVSRTNTITLSDLQPGERTAIPPAGSLYEENAWAVNEGKRLFEWYNCSGCHAHGGGGMGPALMDDEWIYGSSPANIYATIVEGRPNGMPSFRGRIPDHQVWELAAYVRAMAGLVRMDVSPGRSDHMQFKQQEQTKQPDTPVGSSLPKSSEGAR